MTGGTTTAMVGAVAAIGCALISGYFTVRASRSSDDAKSASSQITSTSSQAAVGAVNEGYDTTVKPLFDATNVLIAALQARLDTMQIEIQELKSASSAPRAAGAPRVSPPAPAPPAKLNVPDDVKFQSPVFMKFQQKPLPH